MPDKKIPDLPEKFIIEPNDLFIVEDSIENKTSRIKASNLINNGLTEDTAFYVSNTNGDNSNTGLSEQDAWGTIKYAFSQIEKLKINGYKLRLEIEFGDYTNEGILHLPNLTGAISETCDFGPSEPLEVENTQLDIGPYGFLNGPAGKAPPVVTGPIEVDHFGYYSLNYIDIQFGEVIEFGEAPQL